MDKRHLPFFDLFELSHSRDSGLMPVLCLLSRSLLIPSFLTSVPWTFDFLSLIVQSGHHSLQPFFSFRIKYGIDDGSLVLESP